MPKKKPEAAAVWCSIESLTPWEDNPRLNDGAVEKVRDSIKRFGFASPIVARKEDGMVIAGHTRLRAAAELGLDKVPVRWMDLDPADARMLALADNRVAEVAAWDDAKLANILAEMDEEGLDLGVLGFAEEELEVLLDRWVDPFAGEDGEVALEDPSTRTIRVEVALADLGMARAAIERALGDIDLEAEIS